MKFSLEDGVTAEMSICFCQGDEDDTGANCDVVSKDFASLKAALAGIDTLAADLALATELHVCFRPVNTTCSSDEECDHE